MHQNFFHWHSRAELKPDTTILEPRWNAAAKFAEKVSASDVCSLLRLVLFEGAAGEFAARFSSALVLLEPTFLPENNAELLRVMATAAIYSKMDKPSIVADAVALGLRAAAFPSERTKPICKEIMIRSGEYLAEESERMRPAQNIKANLITTIGTKALEPTGEAMKLLVNALIKLSETMERVAEENQFLWWLVGRQSPLLKERREQLMSQDYALVAAVEAADRVILLPPPPSAESLLNEVLAQCKDDPNASIFLIEAIRTQSSDLVKSEKAFGVTMELTPIAGTLAVLRAGGKADAHSLKHLHLSPKLKASPTVLASQYFRELMFLQAIEEIS
jgi:hypothetical protein